MNAENYREILHKIEVIFEQTRNLDVRIRAKKAAELCISQNVKYSEFIIYAGWKE